MELNMIIHKGRNKVVTMIVSFVHAKCNLIPPCIFYPLRKKGAISVKVIFKTLINENSIVFYTVEPKFSKKSRAIIIGPC